MRNIVLVAVLAAFSSSARAEAVPAFSPHDAFALLDAVSSPALEVPGLPLDVSAWVSRNLPYAVPGLNVAAFVVVRLAVSPHA